MVRSRFVIVAALLLGCGSLFAIPITSLGSYTVSPQGTFLTQDSNDTCSSPLATAGCNENPTFVNLNSLGIVGGDTIGIQAFGSFCYGPGVGNSPCTQYTTNVGGVFSSTNSTTLLGASNADRVQGSLPLNGTETAAVDPPTWFGNTATNGVPDFQIITSNSLMTTIVVPNGAVYLIVGVLDSFLADNSAPDGNIGFNLFDLTPNVPEPATCLLLLVGLGGLLAGRRLRSSRS